MALLWLFDFNLKSNQFFIVLFQLMGFSIQGSEYCEKFGRFLIHKSGPEATLLPARGLPLALSGCKH